MLNNRIAQPIIAQEKSNGSKKQWRRRPAQRPRPRRSISVARSDAEAPESRRCQAPRGRRSGRKRHEHAAARAGPRDPARGDPRPHGRRARVPRGERPGG